MVLQDLQGFALSHDARLPALRHLVANWCLEDLWIPIRQGRIYVEM